MHRHNGLRTAVLLGGLSALILFVGSFFGRTGLFLALLVALAINGYAYWKSDKIALRAMRARPVSEFEAARAVPHRPRTSTAARQPMPRLYISPTAGTQRLRHRPQPAPRRRLLHRGILRMLDERELRGVIGHELSHVYNRDILISSVAGALASVVMFLAQLRLAHPVGRDDDDGPGIVGMLLIMLLGPLAAALIQLAVSRIAGVRGRRLRARSSPATRWRWPARCASWRRAPRRAAAPRAAAGDRQPPDDRQPVPPRRGPGPALRHPPADGRAHRPPGAAWRSGPPP